MDSSPQCLSKRRLYLLPDSPFDPDCNDLNAGRITLTKMASRTDCLDLGTRDELRCYAVSLLLELRRSTDTRNGSSRASQQGSTMKTNHRDGNGVCAEKRATQTKRLLHRRPVTDGSLEGNPAGPGRTRGPPDAATIDGRR